VSGIKWLSFVVAIMIFQFIWQPATAEQPVIYNTRISMGYDGSQADGGVYIISTISNNGRFVVFYSDATNLVPNDTNDKTDVFVFDLDTEIMERVSVASNGVEGDEASGYDDLASISNDGRYVVFSSEATNLVADDTNTDCQRSYKDNNGERVTVNFNCPDIFVKDRLTNEIRLISGSSTGVHGNDSSAIPSISADGRYVAFASSADNLVENDTNGVSDIFVHDLQTGETKRVSIASDGAQANGSSFINRISANGQYVAFETFADNLSPEDIDDQLDVYVHNLQTGETSHISVGLPKDGSNRYALMPDISADGRYVSFLSGVNPNPILQIYRRDRQTETTDIVSVSASGDEGNKFSIWSSISDDGRWVAFTSWADNLVDIDGSVCDSCNNVYLKDMDTGEVKLLTKNIAGDYSSSISSSGVVSISGDGSRVVFDSLSDELVLGDTNKYSDIFVYGWKTMQIYSANLPLILK
jgi:Tol biopolymer transport system component